MQLGIFAKTFPGTDPDAVLAQVAAAGFACTQFNMACAGLAAMPDSIPAGVPAAVAAAARRGGVTIAAVSGTYNMIHPDPALRAAGLARLGALLAAAAPMGTRLVTLCTGTRDPADQWRHHPDNATPQAWADLLAEMAKALDLAEHYGVDLGIEPERANVVRDAAQARRLIAELASPRLRIVLDPANLVEADDDAPWRDTIARAVDLLAPRIVMAHAKDRAADNAFATVGQGAVDFPHYLRCLRDAGFDGPLVTHGLDASEAPEVAAFLRRTLDAG
jgi:sugar phosphate isomerase/epimerase